MKAPERLDDLITRFKQAKQDLETEADRLLNEKREQFRYSLRKGKVVFDREVKRLQRRQRIGSLAYILNAPVVIWLSAPIIYGMLIPLAFLDLTITFYQHICFRIYKIPLVTRSDHIIIDRHRLPYLNTIQKINCVYCGYGNGLIAYAREVLARTEQYWCPIKHAQRIKGAHDRETNFFDYGDAESWKTQLDIIRCDWESPENNKPKSK